MFLDESGATTQMTRNYGRAVRGERVREATPNSHWHTVTMLAALTTQGLQAPMTIESPTDGDVFLAYLEQVLCPRLRPGQVVILDNLAAHKVAGVRELIAATGARLLYLPPYSPDFNPDRTSLVEDQATPPFGQGPFCGRPGTGHRRGLSRHSSGERLRLVRPL